MLPVVVGVMAKSIARLMAHFQSPISNHPNQTVLLMANERLLERGPIAWNSSV
jgi:hypothetical protein